MITFTFRYNAYRDNKLLDAPQTKWLVMILIMFMVTYFVAVNQAYHQKALIEVTKLFVIIALGYKLINTPDKLDWTLWAYVVGAAYIGLEAYNTGRDWQGRVEGIGTATTGDANGVAAMLAPTIPFIIYYAWRGKKLIRALSVVFGVFIVNGLVLLNSRGAFLGVLMASGYFIIYMIFSKFQQANQKASAILIIIFGIGGSIYLTDDVFWDRMGTLKEIQVDERESGSHRVHIWMATFDLIADHPLGVGAAGFQKLSPYYVPEELFFGTQSTKAVHSSWFQSLAELGWPGPILLSALLISCFRLTRRVKLQLSINNNSHHYFQVIAIEGALLCFVVTGSFIDEFRSEIYYWLIMFTACAGNVYLFKSINSSLSK